jgi:hypothetical protein
MKMKKVTVALAVCAFLALGAGVAKADHYHRSNYHNPYRHGHRDRCDYDNRGYRGYSGYQDSYRYAPAYRDSCHTPRYVEPVYGYPSYGYSNFGIGFSTPNFSFQYRR